MFVIRILLEGLESYYKVHWSSSSFHGTLFVVRERRESITCVSLPPSPRFTINLTPFFSPPLPLPRSILISPAREKPSIIYAKCGPLSTEIERERKNTNSPINFLSPSPSLCLPEQRRCSGNWAASSRSTTRPRLYNVAGAAAASPYHEISRACAPSAVVVFIHTAADAEIETP